MAIAAMIGRHLATKAAVGIGKKIWRSRKKKKDKLKIEESPAYKKKVTGVKKTVLKGKPGKLKPIGTYKGKKAKLTPLKKKKK